MGKKIRGITHTKQGAKLFMDRIWSLYFRLLLYDITSFVILFPNFYCHITICLTYFPIRKQKIPEVFQWSWTFPWRKRRLQSSKSSLLYKISQGQFGKKTSARGFCSRKAKLWLKPSLAKYIRNSIVFEPAKFLTGKGWTKRWRRESTQWSKKERILSEIVVETLLMLTVKGTPPSAILFQWQNFPFHIWFNRGTDSPW